MCTVIKKNHLLHEKVLLILYFLLKKDMKEVFLALLAGLLKYNIPPTQFTERFYFYFSQKRIIR